MKMKKYHPSFIDNDFKDKYRVLDVPSAWSGLEKIISAIINDFRVKTDLAIEFGVDYGYSLSVLSNLFKKVVGVDTFKGDDHSGSRNSEEHFNAVKKNFKDYDNVVLIKDYYQNFIKNDHSPENKEKIDLIHIDIVHTFKDTYRLGLWSIENCPVVIFHDTESFPDVSKALNKIKAENKINYYNYPFFNGLGILTKRDKM